MRGVRCEASTSLLFPQCVRWGYSTTTHKKKAADNHHDYRLHIVPPQGIEP